MTQPRDSSGAAVDQRGAVIFKTGRIRVSKERAPVLFSLAGKDRGTLVSTRVYCAVKLS